MADRDALLDALEAQLLKAQQQLTSGMVELLTRLEAAAENVDAASEGLRQSVLFSRELQRLLGYPFGPEALDKSPRAWEAAKSACAELKAIIKELKSDG